MSSLLVVSALVGHLMATPTQVLTIEAPKAAIAQRALVEQAKEARQQLGQRATALVSQAIGQSLQPGWRIERLRFAPTNVHAALAAAQSLRAEVSPHGPWHDGAQTVAVSLYDESGRALHHPAHVTLRAPIHSGDIVLKRGTEVIVTARTGSVHVQTRGLSQSAGALGDTVVVLCDNATRTLSAVVTGPKAVEVSL